MFKNKMSLRLRIFISMIFLVFTAILLILGSTYYQYRTESDQYNSYRQERKENQLKRQINYIVNKYNLSNNYNDWENYDKDFDEITKIHSVEYSIFTIQGVPLFYSYLPLDIISNNYSLDKDFASMLVANDEGKFTSENLTDVGKFQASYSVLKNDAGEKYAILFFPYFQDVSFAESELNVFLSTLYQIYFIMLVVTIVLAYFISRFVTRSIETIRVKIGQTGLLKKNEKIYLNNATKEIDSLVNSYNKMIDDLEDSAERLAKTEREQAWQEMAKQVAHEIKNPLTPMRLTVQSFQKNSGLKSEDEKLKLNDFCEILIEQIDTMSNVATSFSDFATLPKTQLEKTDLVEATKKVVEIFEQNNITLDTSNENIFVKLDKEQWIRVMTNLIKNSIQAIPYDRESNIQIKITESSKKVKIVVSDNGLGVSAKNREKIFEPKFTTKSDGMGLGLGIVRSIINSHRGKISYKSKNNKGTDFTISLPK
ncbi:ATP-binding protein [Flavobacteriaceae bacterium]|nr:ATP-binding protein [Flavobacteriaceae bacterium]MDA8630468.1 ATP-binding protein [Flavobacteriaceae bacterium]MDA8934829.1 ATP-binding protein [Flavobacteriaceae bacterium]MDC0984535.1 ATP-binding protein [Flavobacteriaceae bacterium]